MTNAVLLTSAYLAPVQYYTKIYAADCVVEERHDHYVKQTYRNRCVIAGPGGPLPLTVPVENRPSPHTPTCDVRISDHGNWRHLHWQALTSAYENSPYFEYYADDFRHFYERRFDFLVDFNDGLRRTVCALLALDTPVITTASYLDASAGEGRLIEMTGRLIEKSGRLTELTGRLTEETGAESGLAVTDLRESIRPKQSYEADTAFSAVPYYQVFAQRQGFLPNLSIVDLLFNMGPEARLVLRDGCVASAMPVS